MKDAFWIAASIAQLIVLLSVLCCLPRMYRREAERKERA